MNWFVQFLRESQAKRQLVDDLQAFASLVAIGVFFVWVLWS